MESRVRLVSGSIMRRMKKTQWRWDGKQVVQPAFTWEAVKVAGHFASQGKGHRVVRNGMQPAPPFLDVNPDFPRDDPFPEDQHHQQGSPGHGKPDYQPPETGGQKAQDGVL